MTQPTRYEPRDGKGYQPTDILSIRRGDPSWTTALVNAEDLPLAPWKICNLLNRARAIGYAEAMEDLRNLIGAETRK